MRLTLALTALAALHCALASTQTAFTSTGQRARSTPLDISQLRNNRGTSRDGQHRGGGFKDGFTLPSDYLPTGNWRHDGIDFLFPHSWDLEWDNVRSDKQAIELSAPTELAALHFIAAGEDPGGFLRGETKEEVMLHFEDESQESVHFEVKNWWAHHWTNKGAIRAPFQFDPHGHKVYNASHLFHVPVSVPHTAAGRKVASLTLPAANKWNSLHIFALSYVSAAAEPRLRDKVVPSFVRATRRWEDVRGTRAQVVEVAIANRVSTSRHDDRGAWVDTPITISLTSKTVRTVQPGRIARLMPGDQVLVEVLVTPTGSSASFSQAEVAIEFEGDSDSRRRQSSALRIPVVVEGSALVHDFSKWTTDDADIEQHSAPAWYDQAKFGIFIHWGLFSVPAWSDGDRYSEWYDFWLHDDDETGPVYQHHKRTWGPKVVYDDFIRHFKAEKFNPSEWVKLIADSGAKYFVFTTKHHDGYALFDTGKTSKRNSLLLGPRRDFLKELMETAKKEQPQLKRGTYFSMPEWYNPLYVPHGRVSFPGGPAHNPFTGKVEPYTGFVDVGDYITGLQLPQMRILANDYETDLMWCDIGLDNASATFVSEWYSSSAKQGRQVAIDNRCGIGGDFDTPEMTKFATVQPTKWEVCTSVDPYSFGYSAVTKDDEYRNSTEIVHMLVDIVSKGGNLLLNIGPKADGSIIHQMAQPLREVGQWLKVNGRAIYGTYAFAILPEVETEDVHVEITRTDRAFYLISLKEPVPTMNIPAPLPILPCDTVSLITKHGDVRVPWEYKGGSLTLDLGRVRKEDITGGIAYVFEVSYGDCSKRMRDEL